MTTRRARALAQTVRPETWIRPLASAALLSAAALISSALAAKSEEQKIIKSYGYSFYGNLDYPEDYTHLAYVNPEAPKGGEIAIPFVGTLDSMNPYSGKGRAA